MNEAETRAELIDPALRAAGWESTDGARVRREVIAPGTITGDGRRVNAVACDYVLTWRGKKLATIEAKARNKPDTEGVGQAKDYAQRLRTRYAFSTNGRRIYRIDMHSGTEGYVDAYPTPEELWEANYPAQNDWRMRFAEIPFEDGGKGWTPRYYQHNAIEATLEAIAAGKKRILLTLATGTGKTAIAFQIAWKLFQSRWNLSGEPTRRPRILFLADRNILADQAFNAFSAFAEDARARIDPDEIRKKGGVPKNASIFFTIFQTFMTGKAEDGSSQPYFGDYPPDFFDLVVIDECHRGGANDESTWRDILSHFEPAVQIGLTATPKRTGNVDTYAYFGEPVYVYALKEGINDGFLTPFRVRQFATTLDDYTYVSDDEVIEGEVEVGDRFEPGDFNRRIVIEERERFRVQEFMRETDQRQKTLVFCATQDHAAMIRDLINQEAASTDPFYCVRVTANDGALGEQHLRTFQDNEKTIPTILTTSQKLSTGVDARNIRNIVLLRPCNNMIEFKQIIGRGTRLYEGKTYFTIYDFVRAHERFNDPDWDGEPVEPDDAPEPRPPGGMVDPESGEWHPPDDGEGTGEPQRSQHIRIKLADGKERQIQSMAATSFWSPDGKPMSAREFIEALFGVFPTLFADEDELRKIWSDPETRSTLLDGLAERGFGTEQLRDVSKLIDAERSDLFDVLAYIAFTLAPMTRNERVNARRESILDGCEPKLRTFLDFVLYQYVEQGVKELDLGNLGNLLELKYHSVSDAVSELGSVATIRTTFRDFQGQLYEPNPQ